MSNISKYLENINDVSCRHSMYVETFYMDREFKNIRLIMLGISTLNTTAEADHVP